MHDCLWPSCELFAEQVEGLHPTHTEARRVYRANPKDTDMSDLLLDPQDDDEPAPYFRRGDDPGDDALAGHYDDE